MISTIVHESLSAKPLLASPNPQFSAALNTLSLLRTNQGASSSIIPILGWYPAFLLIPKMETDRSVNLDILNELGRSVIEMVFSNTRAVTPS